MTTQFTMNDLNTSFNTGFNFNVEDQLNEENIEIKHFGKRNIFFVINRIIFDTKKWR